MSYRFISPKSDGGAWDFAIDAITLGEAFVKFTANHWLPGQTGDYAVWCGLHLAGYVSEEESGPEMYDLHPVQKSHANPFACGD